MTRTRSEYLLPSLHLDHLPPARPDARPVDATDRDALAELLLAAYRGTIDDEGEELPEAFDAIDHYLGCIVLPHSFVTADHLGLTAMSFVVVVNGRHYIDPVATHPRAKRTGVGRGVVATSLRSLAAAGVGEVGATITDGNTASERLFASLGFERSGAW